MERSSIWGFTGKGKTASRLWDSLKSPQTVSLHLKVMNKYQMVETPLSPQGVFVHVCARVYVCAHAYTTTRLYQDSLWSSSIHEPMNAAIISIFMKEI